ncbi:hypothetical protein [Kitasatospora cinereorecta]|uniref:hypothetical protein n=1 Tax=Kitasatospora cinereorecta TaxID=285560 RepID=UPI0031F72B1B
MPTSTPAAPPTAVSSAAEGEDGPSGSAASASATRRTPVSLLLVLAKAISDLATASADFTASAGRRPVPVISIIGASGEVVPRTVSESVATECPVSAAAAASTCGWPASRPYAWAKLTAVAPSPCCSATTTT